MNSLRERPANLDRVLQRLSPNRTDIDAELRYLLGEIIVRKLAQEGAQVGMLLLKQLSMLI